MVPYVYGHRPDAIAVLQANRASDERVMFV